MAPTVQNPNSVQTPPESPTPAVPVLEQAKPSRARPVLVLVLILLAIVFVVVAFFIKGGKVENSGNQSTLPEVSNPPVPVMAQYASDEYNFKFRYNDIWELAEASASGVLGSKASFGFTFKNTLPEATLEAKPNLPKLIIYVFEKNPSLDNFIKDLSGDKQVDVADCPGAVKQCKTIQAKDAASPFPVQVVRQGVSYTYGFAMLDENQKSASLVNIPQPLGAVIGNFTSQ